MFLPPLTTLVTRLMLTTCSFRFRFCVSMRLGDGLNAIRLKLQSRFPCGVGERFHAPVIQIPAAIEDHASNSFFPSAFGYGFADLLCALYIAAFAAQILFCR